MQVLVALAREPEAILSRDDLIASVWEGRNVGDASINRVMSLLRAALRDAAGEAVTVETLPKVGHRLSVMAVPRPTDEGPAAPGPARKSARMWAIAAIMLAILAGALTWWWASQPQTERIVIVMLPVEVGAGVDPIYASGMEAAIRSQLGRSEGMEVRAGESAGHLQRQGRTIGEIGTALKADLVWQARLDTSAEAISLTASLTDPGDGSLVWSENLRSAPDAAQFLPLRAVREILLALGRPLNPDAQDNSISNEDYALYLSAMGLIKGRGVEQRLAAVEVLEQVVDRNPNFADGIAGLAKANYLYPARSYEELDERRQQALEQAEQALALDPSSVDALKVSGMLVTNDHAESVSRLRRATQIDPGDAEAWYWFAMVQGRAPTSSEDVLHTAVRMVEVDPLWPASWAASSIAVEHGEFDLARDIEQTIIAAAATDTQRVLAEARIARIDGDLSEYVRLLRGVQMNLNDAERRFGTLSHMHMIVLLLELPEWDAPHVADHLLRTIERGNLPTRAELEAGGITADNFFSQPAIAVHAAPLMSVEGRNEEFLEYLDHNFADVSDFERFAEETEEGRLIIPMIAPYIIRALQEAGRMAEARQYRALLRDEVSRWREAGNTSLMPTIFELNLAAIEGDTSTAISAVRRLPQLGWPLQMSHSWMRATGLLTADPLYDDIRDLPEVRAVLDPIRAHIARERREVLALNLE